VALAEGLQEGTNDSGTDLGTCASSDLPLPWLGLG